MPAEAQDLEASALPPFDGPVARKASVPELDIRRLRPRRGLPRGYKLSWGVENAEAQAFAVVDEAAGILRLEIWSGSGGKMFARQSITLVKGRRRGDMFCQCPVSGRRCVKLYLRQGRFASPQAQALA